MRVLGTPAASISFAYSPHPDQADWDAEYGAYNSDPANELFNPAGGGATLLFPPSAACMDPTCPNMSGRGWNFGPIPIESIGTAGGDYLTAVIGLSLEVCSALNQGLGLPVPPAPDPDADLFTEIDAYPGAAAACLEAASGSDLYVYYQLLEAQ